MRDYVLAGGFLLLLVGFAVLAGLLLDALFGQPIPEPVADEAPQFLPGSWEYGQPYRYTGSHRASDAGEATRDLGSRASRLRTPGYVTVLEEAA